LPNSRRLAKPAFVLLALAGLAVAISACALVKLSSLAVSQPGGIGPARVHFLLCTEPEGEAEECSPNNPPEPNEQLQYLLGIAVPPGSSPPQTITAVPLTGGTPITYSLNKEVATELAAASQVAAAEEPALKAWPPTGLEGVGYLSAPHVEEVGVTQEWSVDADFGLPAGTGPFSGPFASAVAEGSREISAGHPATAPVHCWRFAGSPEEGEALCFPTAKEVQVGTSDLRIAPPKTTQVFVGGRAPVKFKLDFASTAPAVPTLGLGATTSVKGGKTTLVSGASFVPGALDPGTHRAPVAHSEVMVSVPKGTKPGTYEVTLTGTASQGGTSSAVAKLKVTKPKLKFGGVKLNKKNGTATLKVKVPGGGRLTVAGKGIVKAKKTSKKAKTLKVAIKATGTAKSLLEQTGKAKVKIKATFKPSSGIQVSKTKAITLKLG
jgi:hypothetical protein